MAFLQGKAAQHVHSARYWVMKTKPRSSSYPQRRRARDQGSPGAPRISAQSTVARQPICENSVHMIPPENLHSLKDDMIAFIEGHGMRRFPGFVIEDVPSIQWEDENNPDSWKDFVEMAKTTAAPFLTMSDITLEKEDLETLLEDLRDFNFPDEMPGAEEAEYLVNYVGKTGFVQLGFAHQGVMFIHESSTEWYERYQHLLESLEDLHDIVIDDGQDEG